MTELQLSFIQIGDTHIKPDEPDYKGNHAQHGATQGAEAMIRSIRSLNFTPDFVLHVGDVAYDPHPEIYPAIAKIFEPLPYPVYYVRGNHDHSEGMQRHLMRREESEITPYLSYEFEVKGVQFVVIDSNGDATPPTGHLVGSQLDYLDQICSVEDERPLVVSVHHNVIETGVPWLDDWMGIENSDEMHYILGKASRRLRGVFHGHVHQNFSTVRDGIAYYSCASSWVNFASYPTMTETEVDHQMKAGYSVVSLTPQQTFVRRYSFDIDDK